MIGSELGHYKILSALGKGGMGEVYLAEDTKLDRQVAIKVLPESLRSDDTRLERFRREARASASLKHPNIATIYSIEEADDVLFIVMEHVEGKTLAEHIPSEGMELEAFFSVFIPLADALAHAYDNGRVHRDIKPGNIMLTGDGTPKILDFGLARIEQEGGDVLESDTPTMTMKEMPPSLTQGRSFLGTPAYMSPEQIEGSKVDARTDLFSFGVVMYEALTGQRPFKGETVESVIARILEIDPTPATELKPASPYMLWQVIRRCLVKKRDERMQTALEMRHELEAVQGEMQAGTILVDASTIPEPQAEDVAPAEPQSIPLWRQPTALGLAVVTLIIGLSLAWLLKPEATLPHRKFKVDIENLRPRFPRSAYGASISPDGRMIAYLDKGQLWIRHLNQTKPRALPNTVGAYLPFWSPDNDWIGYVLGREIHKIEVQGTSDITLLEVPLFPVFGASWSPAGKIVFSFQGRRRYLGAVSSNGGAMQPFAFPDTVKGERGIADPSFLPDGHGILFKSTRPNTKKSEYLMIQTESARSEVILNMGPGSQQISHPTYSTSGHIVYQRGGYSDGSIWAVPFDLSTLKASGEAFPVAEKGVRPSVSMDGTLVFQSDSDDGQYLSWISREGELEGLIGESHLRIFSLGLSPEGKRVAIMAEDGYEQDGIWIHDVTRGIRSLFSDTLYYEPSWTNIEGQLSYLSDEGRYSVDLNRNQKAQRVEGLYGRFPSWSRDGRYVVFDAVGIDSTRDVFWRDLSTQEQPKPLSATAAEEGFAQISPDGRYVAFQSDRSGRLEVYVVDSRGNGQPQVASINGGSDPRWNPQGGELFYVEGDRFMVVEVSTQPTLDIGPSRPLFSGGQIGVDFTPLGRGSGRRYDVSLDGERFMMVYDGGPAKVHIWQNWYAEFEDRN